MKYISRSVQAAVVLVLLYTNILTAAIVGTTKGEFTVNQGTASYTLKIEVPPGIAGMEPELSLNYSSGSGNGYLGVGWSIGGVSAITRCAQTRAVDGVSHTFGVKYDRNDRFCLDGKRLIVTKGNYGADGSEYRTEIDTYAKIVARGDYNGGPRYFEVKTKSGLRYLYGYGDYSYQISKSGGVMAFWKVSRIYDSYSNMIRFYYKSNYALGYHYLDKIEYADNTIEYKYSDTRNDIIRGYYGGYPFLTHNIYTCK